MFETKVGDKVGYGRSYSGHWQQTGFGTVKKINGYGHIIVAKEPNELHADYPPAKAELVFDKWGQQKGHKYTSGLQLLTEARLLGILEAEQKQAAVYKAFSDLEVYLAKMRYNAKVFVAAQDKTALAALVEALIPNYEKD